MEHTAAAEGPVQAGGGPGPGRAPTPELATRHPQPGPGLSTPTRVFAWIWNSPDLPPRLKGVAAEEISLQSLQILYCRCHLSATGVSVRPGRGEGVLGFSAALGPPNPPY